MAAPLSAFRLAVGACSSRGPLQSRGGRGQLMRAKREGRRSATRPTPARLRRKKAISGRSRDVTVANAMRRARRGLPRQQGLLGRSGRCSKKEDIMRHRPTAIRPDAFRQQRAAGSGRSPVSPATSRPVHKDCLLSMRINKTFIETRSAYSLRR